MLSLAFSRGTGLTQEAVRAFVTLELPVQLGVQVLVLQIPAGQKGGNCWAHGVCIAVREGAFDVMPLVRTGRGRRPCEPEKGVPTSRIRHADSIICSQYEAATAASLADDKFPGARRDAILRSGWTRTSVKRNELTAHFLRSRSVVTVADGGAKTAKTKVRWMLTEGIPQLRKRLNKLLVAEGLAPSSEAHFRALVSGKEYTKLTADTCCCATCSAEIKLTY